MKVYFWIFGLIIFAFSCSIPNLEYYPVIPGGESQNNQPISFPSGWRGVFYPAQNLPYSTAGQDSLLTIKQDLAEAAPHWPYHIQAKILVQGSYKGRFSDWNMILCDSTTALTVYISGGSGIGSSALGTWITAEVWGAEYHNGEIQITALSNISFSESFGEPYFQIRNWNAEGYESCHLYRWTAPVHEIIAGSVYEVKFENYPTLRVDKQRFESLHLEKGDWLSVQAAVTTWKSVPEVDLVTLHPGNLMDYIYIHYPGGK